MSSTLLANAAEVFNSTRPLVFEPNHGQAPSDARYLLHDGPMEALFLNNGVRLALPQSSGNSIDLGIEFVGADPEPTITGVSQLAGISNYLLGKDSSLWLRGIPNYAQVEYRSIYPRVDVSFYGNGGSLEHDFKVAPGGDPSRIKFRLNGSESIHISNAGDLEVTLPAGMLVLRKPNAYQESPTGRAQVKADYELAANGTVRFKLGSFDKSIALVIDPVLDFATYLANDSTLYVQGVASDSSGNTYIVGQSFSASYPVTSGSFQTTCSACASNQPAIFITKLNASGTAQAYSTFLGGSNYNQPTQIAVDSNGDAIVIGYTESSDFPLKNPISSGSTCSANGFVTSLSPDGSSLNFSTCLGGNLSGFTDPGGVAVDTSGNLYVSGTTNSADFPVTAGALNAGTPNGADGGSVFLIKLLASGNLSYSAILGAIGDASECCSVIGVAADSAGEAYVAGTTGNVNSAPSWPITPGAYQSNFIGSSQTAPFAAKISADGSALVYSTLIASGLASGMALTSDGSVILTGAYGGSIPVTSNAFSSVVGTSFIAKLSADGTKLPYATYFSTPAGDTGGDITNVAVDGSGNVWVAGNTYYTSNVPVVDPLQSLPGTLNNQSGTAFVSEFNPSIQTLLFSTYFNGAQSGTRISGLAIDSAGRAHIAGTGQDDLPTTPSAYLGTVTSIPANYTSEYGFAALIDPAVPAPAVCVSATSGLYFGGVTVGTSLDQPLTVTNCGTQSITITGVSAATNVFTIPTSENGCTQSVSAGQSCTLSVRYTPAAAETDSSTLTIQSNAPIPQAILPLGGNGVVPVISVQGPSGFDYTIVGQTSVPRPVIIQDAGGSPLVLNAANTTVSGDFALQGVSACTSPFFSCYFLVTFTPTASGTRTGTLTIASNDPANPIVTVQLQAVGYANAPIPQITSLTSQLVPAGTAQTNFAVQGFGFFPSSIVEVNGVPQQTAYQNSSFLTATLAANSIPANSYGELAVTVVTPAPGGGSSAPYTLTEFQIIPANNAFLLYEPISQQLFASTPASAIDYANTVMPINPVNATLGTPIPVGNDPGVLAASSDGKYLFVALNAASSIQRINLTTNAVDETFALPVDPEFGNLKVFDMHVVPGSDTDVVASLMAPDVDPSEDGIAYFNASGLVNWIPGVGGHQGAISVDGFTFTNTPSVLYAISAYGAAAGFTEISYSSAGVQYSGNTCCVPTNTGQFSGNYLATDGSLLYTQTGEAWNPSGTGAVVDAYAVPPYSVMDTALPDASTGNVYYLNQNGSYFEYQAMTVLAFNQTTLAQTGSLSFTDTSYGGDSSGTQLVRWGSNGFAFRGYNSSDSVYDSILIFTSSIAKGRNLTPSPLNDNLSPSWTYPGGPDFVLTVNGSGFVAGSTIQWNNAPRLTTFVSSTQLTATIYASDIASAGVAQVTVANPGQGPFGSGALPFTIFATAPPVPSASLSPASLAFGSESVGASSSVQTATLTNSSSVDLTDISIALTGADTNSFTETSNCNASLSAGDSCAISVVFTPTTTGAQSATINVSDSAASSPQGITLSGAGVSSASQGALQFIPATPCRIADTRLGSGSFGAPELSAGETREFDVPQSACNIPSTAVAYSLNVTVVPNVSLNHLTLWPTGEAQPNVSTLNSLDGRIKANAAITPAGANGGVDVYVTDATQVILDIDGYFVPASTASALAFYPVTPCRIADTRIGTGPLAGPSLPAQGSRSFPVLSSPCNLPSTAQAYSLNVTAIPNTTLDYLTSWPTGGGVPNVSTLNAPTGEITANAAIVPSGNNGEVSIFVSDAANVILDVNGYFAPPGTGGLSLYTVTPCRALDTRPIPFTGTTVVSVQGSACAPPISAEAYVLNATVVPVDDLDYLTLWPDVSALPNVSTLNALDGAITSNMAIVPTNDGAIDAFAQGTTNLILDISSYFAP